MARRAAAAEKLRKYNSAEIKKSVFDERARELRTELIPDIAKEIPVDPLGLSGTRSPTGYFIRADILALRYQRRFRWLSLAIFTLASLAWRSWPCRRISGPGSTGSSRPELDAGIPPVSALRAY
jgi:hypothetical protein